ncbi:hypothetical protein GCM10027053_14980 [Intrasporangium mesophilum]
MDPRDRWLFDGRHSAVTRFSDVSSRDGYGWELSDVGPGAGRGLVCEAFYDDSLQAFTFTAAVTSALPFALIHQFVTEAAQDIGPTPEWNADGHPTGTRQGSDPQKDEDGEAESGR